MCDDVSWQKLVGIEDGKEEDKSLSPVFLKNQWTVMRKCKNDNGCSTGAEDTKVINENKAINVKTLLSDQNDSEADDGETCLFSPIKQRKSFKRKSLDHPLSGSLTPNESGSLKRSRIIKTPSQQPSLVVNRLNEDCLSNILSPTPSHQSISGESVKYLPSSKILNHVKRNIIYTSNKTSATPISSCKLSINDLYKSILAIEEADSKSPSNKPITVTLPKTDQFVTVSSLVTENDEDVRRKEVIQFCNNSHDTCGDFRFSEVKKVYHSLKSGNKERDSKTSSLDSIVVGNWNIEHNGLKMNNRCKSLEEADQILSPKVFTKECHEKSTNNRTADELLTVNPLTSAAESLCTEAIGCITEHKNNPTDGNSSVSPSKMNDFEDPTPADILDYDTPRKRSLHIETSSTDPNSTRVSIAVRKTKKKFQLMLTPNADRVLNRKSRRKSKVPKHGVNVVELNTSPNNMSYDEESVNVSLNRLNFTPQNELSEITSVCPSISGDELNTDTNLSLETYFSNITSARNNVSPSCYRPRTSECAFEESNVSDNEIYITEVESRLQGVVDKPSSVPIQRLLSDSFDMNSTVVQFTTASGSVVKTSQEYIDKAEKLMLDILLDKDTGRNDFLGDAGNEEVSNVSMEGSEIKYPIKLNGRDNSSQVKTLLNGHNTGTKNILPTPSLMCLPKVSDCETNIHKMIEPSHFTNVEQDKFFESTLASSNDTTATNSVSTLAANEDNTDLERNTKNTLLIGYQIGTVTGFLCASGKRTSVSDSSLHKAQALWNSLMEDDTAELRTLGKYPTEDVPIKNTAVMLPNTAGGSDIYDSSTCTKNDKITIKSSNNNEINPKTSGDSKDQASDQSLITNSNPMVHLNENSTPTQFKIDQNCESTNIIDKNNETIMSHNETLFEDFEFATENFINESKSAYKTPASIDLKLVTGRMNSCANSSENKCEISLSSETPFRKTNFTANKKLFSLSSRSRIKNSCRENSNSICEGGENNETDSIMKTKSNKEESRENQKSCSSQVKINIKEETSLGVNKAVEHKLSNDSNCGVMPWVSKSISTEKEKEVVKEMSQSNKIKMDQIFNLSRDNKKRSLDEISLMKTPTTILSKTSGKREITSKESCTNIKDDSYYEKAAQLILKSPEYDLKCQLLDTFHTAKGTRINVSTACLERVKRKFSDEFQLVTDENVEFTQGDCSVDKVEIQHSAAKDQQINFPKKNLRIVSNTLMGGVKNSDNQLEVETLVKSPEYDFKRQPPVVLSTANGKVVNIPEKSLTEARPRFEDDSEILSSEEEMLHRLAEDSKAISTENYMNVNIPKSNLMKVKCNLKRNMCILKSPGYDLHVPDSQSLNPSTCIALSRKNFLEDKLQPKDRPERESVNTLSSRNEIIDSSTMFSTARGSKITISKKSLKQVKDTFKDELDTSYYEQEVECLMKSPEYNLQNPISSAIVTANGNKIQLSQKSLKLANEKFSDMFKKSECNNHAPECMLKPMDDVNFNDQNRTSGNETLSDHRWLCSAARSDLTEENLNGLKDKFSENLKIEKAIPSRKPANSDIINEMHSFPSPPERVLTENNFDTTKKKIVSSLQVPTVNPLSDDNQFQAHVEFNDSILCPNPSKDITPKDARIIFLTAGGGRVTVSEESLQKVRNQFKNDLDIEDTTEPFNHDGKSGVNIPENIQVVGNLFNKGYKENDKIPKLASNSIPATTVTTPACGRVCISGDSLQKAQNNFKELMEVNDNSSLVGNTKKNTTDKADFIFLTAREGEVNISEDSLQQVRNQLKDEFETELSSTIPSFTNIVNNECPKKLEAHNEPKRRATNNRQFMFSTAGGGKVTVSEDSLMQVRNQFKDEFEDHFAHEESAASDTVSDKKLQNVQDQLESVFGVNDNIVFKRPANSDTCEGKTFMFSTAGGSRVTVSEDSLNKIRNQFKDEFGAEVSSTVPSCDSIVSYDRSKKLLQNQVKDILEVRYEPKIPGSYDRQFMFSTASGGSVSVSEDSLMQVRNQFKDEDQVSHMKSAANDTICDEKLQRLQNQLESAFELNDNIVYKRPAISNTSDDTLFMFSTAGGSRVNVSEDSLQKVRNQFKDDLDIEDSSSQEMFLRNRVDIVENVQEPRNQFNRDTKEDYNFSRFGSFSADGTVCVTEDSLQEGRNHDSNRLPYDKISRIGQSLFSTAGGSSVRVSERSLLNVRNMFKEDLEIHKGSSTDSPSADHNNVLVSASGGDSVCKAEKNLQKVRKQGNEEFTVNNIINNDNAQMSGFMFSTAKGSSVMVSEESLQKVRNQFRDIEVDNENSSIFYDPNKATTNVSYKMDNILNSDKCQSDFICNQESSKRALALDKNRGLSATKKEAKLEKIKSSMVTSKKVKIDTFNTNLNHPFRDKNSLSNNYEKSEKDLTRSVTYSGALEGHKSNDDLKIIEHFPLSSSSSKKIILSPKSAEPTSNFEDDPYKTPINRKKRKALNFINDDIGSNSKVQLMSQEIHEIEAAFIADDNNSQPFISSPSGFFNRSKIKPLTSWCSELDNDEEIFVAAVTPRKPGSPEYIFDSVTGSASSFVEKRKTESQLTSQPLSKKMKIIEEIDCINMDEIICVRQQRRQEQKSKITANSSNHPLPSPGLYMIRRRKEKLLKLMEGLLSNPTAETFENLLDLGFGEAVISITSKNATDFQFSAEEFFSKEECFSKNGAVELDSGFTIILSDSNKIGLEEISYAFLSNPDIDPSLIPRDWIKNHYRWIIWKLASLEKSFPRILFKRLLVPINVLHQLKYRYDREIDLVQRPALRRILECDEPASRRFIACVADIRKVESDELEPGLEMELTDGWYSIWATVDTAMVNLIKQGKVYVGTKLVIYGAELINCSEGCDPLQVMTSVRLKIHSNSVRRAKWYAKMGFMRYPGPMSISLDSVLPDGGTVGLMNAVIARVYPMLYMSKDLSGKTVVRNSQAENQLATLHEKERISKSEVLYEQLLIEVESNYKKGPVNKLDMKNVKGISNPETLWRIVSQEPEFHASLNSEQVNSVRAYHEKISMKIQEDVQSLLKRKLEELVPERKVTTLMKLRIVDPLTESSALVTIWRPPDDLCGLLVENLCFEFHALNACGLRDRVLQLSNTKATRYKESSAFNENHKFARTLTAMGELTGGQTFPTFGELDVVGVVIHVREPDKPWGVTNVYLSDLDNNFLMITFWTSLKNFGCDELLKEGSIVAGLNLHWRQGSGSYVVPSTFVNELTYFSSHPSQKHVSTEISKLKDHFLKEDKNAFVETRQEALFALLKERNCSVTPLRRTEADVSPNVAKRIEKLKRYGPASPLPKAPLISSPDVRKSFISPKAGKIIPHPSTV